MVEVQKWGKAHSRGRGCNRRGRGRGRGCSRGRGCGGGRGNSFGDAGTAAADGWKWNEVKEDDNQLMDFPLTGDLPGPKGDAVGVTGVLECFHLFIPKKFYENLTVQSNLYVHQERAKKATPQFIPFTVYEIMAFVGIVIAMGPGVVCLPTLHHYWSTDAILSHPWFRAIMS